MFFFKKYETLCKESGKTPTGVALELGLSRASVSRWRHDGMPSAEALLLIADYFNVSTDYLLGRTTIITTPQSLNPDDIAKTVLLGNADDVSDAMWNEIKDFAEFLKAKYSV